MSRVTNREGFTLIELVIVLAIAALILAGILLAVSGAQRSRRDSQRKTDAGTVVSEIEEYASNNQGVYPSDSADLSTFATDYPDANNIKDPSTGGDYTFTYQLGDSTHVPSAGTMYLSIDATCSGSTATASAGNDRKYALVVGLEAGGSACYGD